MAKRILVIDDEELIIKSLSILLEKDGYEVFVAKNGQDAIVMIEEGDFNLILSDIRMPGINGSEAVEQIYKQLQAGNRKRIPVIFISGYVDEKVENEVKKLNPVAFIYKPFDIDNLIDKIKKTIG